MVKNVRAVVISERHVRKLDFAVETFDIYCVGFVGNILGRVHKVAISLEARDTLLILLGKLHEDIDRAKQRVYEQQVRDKIRRVDMPFLDKRRARNRSQNVHDA